MINEMCKCIKCGGTPHILKLEDFYYVQCDCIGWNPYCFLGAKINNAIDEWNFANRTLTTRKKK